MTGERPAETTRRSDGVDIRERMDIGLLLIRGRFGDRGFEERFAAIFGAAPPAGREPLSKDGVEMRRIGRTEWLVAGPFDVVEDVDADAGVLLTDGRVIFDVSGEASMDVIARSCALRLDEESFPIGLGTRTRFAGIGAYVERRAARAFRIIVDRSYAAHIRAWIARAAGDA